MSEQETLGQREQRRKAEREAREAQQPEDLGIAGTFHMDDEWMDELLEQFGQEDVVGGSQDDPYVIDQDIAGAEAPPDPNIQSREYKISELEGKLKSLGLMIRMFASQVEGVPILNVMFDDKTGELRMAPTHIRL
jgi:hypothetical protein